MTRPLCLGQRVCTQLDPIHSESLQVCAAHAPFMPLADPHQGCVKPSGYKNRKHFKMI